MQFPWILVWSFGCCVSPVLEPLEVGAQERFRQQPQTMTGDAWLGKGGKWPRPGICARVRGLYRPRSLSAHLCIFPGCVASLLLDVIRGLRLAT
ncbi:hypothetical protein C1949_04320 [Halopseudomonas oceani]|uniref:Uncharacterized protein n=1 Tax=Halopseudomonas oceani TaxID=1708783 RepID=A0A2P4EXS2_9GAMM|nr:hypothetical protein C1949_04320 [Halopseudomonas oceani]